ncbi:MAG: gamma-glutamylcyclotransferase family protein [Hyphomicrobiaceae bacterium]|nr:gamma-glutamylcyclotransferase family protein [Hyphomicrobiaceae bacterium]
MSGEAHLVFVYGTLKRGFPNHGYMDGARLLGAARTKERYPLVVGNAWFTPYLLPEPGEGHRVKGELWEVPDAMMPALDELESTHLPNGYRRREIPVVPDGAANSVMAWTYFRDRRHLAVIHTGYLDDYQDRRYVASEDRGI